MPTPMPMPTPTPTVAKAADERERLFEPPRRFRAHTLDRFLQLCAKRLRGTEQRQTFVEPQNAFEFECDTLIVSGFELRTLATLRDLCLQISKCLCFIGSDPCRIYNFETVTRPCDNDTLDDAFNKYRRVFARAIMTIVLFELIALNWTLLQPSESTPTSMSSKLAKLRTTISNKYTEIATKWCGGYWLGGAAFVKRYRFMAATVDGAILLTPPTSIMLSM